MDPVPDQPDIVLTGRIDGLTATSVRARFDEALAKGTGRIAVELSGVTYVSSAGLRVFMQVQKELKKAGGEVVLIAPPAAFTELLRISGMDRIFSVRNHTTSNHVAPPLSPPGKEKITLQEEDITIVLEKLSASTGTFTGFGDPGLLATASFRQEDIHRIPLGKFFWGTGIGTTGNQFSGFSDLFGETVILGGHLLTFPAVRRPSVDYLFHHPGTAETVNFLYGFGLTGSFWALGSFETKGTGDLSLLFRKLSELVQTGTFGIVLAGRSGGILGMHLRRSPASGALKPGVTVFDPEQFPVWFSFPDEPEDHHAIVLATGLYSDPSSRVAGMAEHLPAGSPLHLHAAVMERGLINSHPSELLKEVDRIIRESEPLKVVHLLPSSRLTKGIFGVIPL